jgi:hypothetical protein
VVLFGNDMVNFVNGVEELLRHLAVFATRIGALPNFVAKKSVHFY